MYLPNTTAQFNVVRMNHNFQTPHDALRIESGK